MIPLIFFALSLAPKAFIVTAACVFLGNPLNGDNLFGGVGMKDYHSLSATSRDPNAIDWAPDQFPAICHEHDLVTVFDRHSSNKLAVSLIDRHSDDTFAAAT